MSDVSHDAIVQYWMTHPTVILGVWVENVFKPAGVCSPAQVIGTPGPDERAAFCGYLFAREWWGSDEMEVLALLGIAIMFTEINLVAMHGTRYEQNDATAKFMERFGFRDLATLPHQLVRDGKLVSATFSTVTRETFEMKVEEMILKAYLESKKVL
jgi:RimJ/RimL family protein N-acetyltransferase